MCRVPSKPMTVSQKCRLSSTSSSDDTSESDEDVDESDDNNDVSVAVQLSPPALPKNNTPDDGDEDAASQVNNVHHVSISQSIQTILTCAQKQTSSQLSLPHGTIN